jgi:hypothetical protein
MAKSAYSADHRVIISSRDTVTAIGSSLTSIPFSPSSLEMSWLVLHLMLVRADNVSNSAEQGKSVGRGSGERAHGEVRGRGEGESCLVKTPFVTLHEEYIIQIQIHHI